MITEAFVGPLVGACEGGGVIGADVEGLVLGVALAFVDGLLVALGFGLALAVLDGLVLAVAVGVLEVADDTAGVGDGIGATLVAVVGGGDCGGFELGVAMADEIGASDAGALAAGVAFVVAFERATRDIATDPMMSAATPAAAATTVMIPRPRAGDSPDCGNSRALLCARHNTSKTQLDASGPASCARSNESDPSERA